MQTYKILYEIKYITQCKFKSSLLKKLVIELTDNIKEKFDHQIGHWYACQNNIQNITLNQSPSSVFNYYVMQLQLDVGPHALDFTSQNFLQIYFIELPRKHHLLRNECRTIDLVHSSSTMRNRELKRFGFKFCASF